MRSNTDITEFLLHWMCNVLMTFDVQVKSLSFDQSGSYLAVAGTDIRSVIVRLRCN
jgi:hypothetical protein